MNSHDSTKASGESGPIEGRDGVNQDPEKPGRDQRIAEADERTEEANTRTQQAEVRTDEANTRTDEANVRTKEANTREEKANTRTDLAEHSERMLRASELSYRRLFESARDGILILDADTGCITDVNPFLIELLGISHSYMLGKTVGDLSPLKDTLSNQAMLERLQKDGYIRYEDLPLETRDGHPISVEFVSNVYQVGDKRVIQCNIRDITNRKAAEMVKSRLGAIVESSDDAIFGTDLVRIITSWNKAAEKIFGYTAAEMVGTSNLRLIPTDLQDEENQIHAKIQRGEHAGHLETLRQSKDGRRVEVSVTASPIKDATGRVLGVSMIVRDIRVRKEQEREILRLSQLYAALSHINQAIVTLNNREELFARICRVLVEIGKMRMAWVGWLDTNTRQVNRVAQCGETIDFLPQVPLGAEGQPEAQGPSDRAIREERNYICNDFSRDERTLLWRKAAKHAGYQSAASLVIRLGGVICGTITVYSGDLDFFQDPEIALLEEAAADVSFALDNFEREAARRQAEIELRWKTAFLEAKVDSSLDGILVVNDQGMKILQNQRLNDLWKIPPEIAGNMNDSAQVKFFSERSKNPREFTDKVVYLNTHPDEVSRDEIELIDGTVLDRYSSPVRDKAGNQYGRIWTFRDITERKRLETQFRQLQKMESIGQLASGVAHDFNNILGVIQMQSDLLKCDALSTNQSDLTDGIVASVQRGVALTRQLLLFSRREVFRPIDLDLNNTITTTSKMLKRMLGETIEMELKLAAQPLYLHVDAGMLDQVLVNLCVNAHDAMPGGGRLVIETCGVELDELAVALSAQARPGSFACLSVTDNGIGIPQEILPQIFEPFFTTKDVGKGTGLGLATVFGIVKQHQGWINVHSETGHGTTFSIYLPRLVGNVVIKSEPPEFEGTRGGHETILLTEDDPALRVAIRQALSHLGYRILEASSGIKALEVWNENRDQIALLLTDLVMPGGMTGKELAQRLLQLNPKLKVIYMSGYCTEVVGKDFPLTENVGFLTKPFSAQTLTQIIRDLLAAPPA